MMHQAGLLDFAARKSTQKSKRNPCSIDSKNKDNKNGRQSNSDPVMLKLSDLIEAFIILGAGFSFAILVLFLELILNRFSGHK